MVLVHLSLFIFDHGNGAVVSHYETCTKIGVNFLEAGGSAIDAAIGTMLCEGVIMPNRAGIGGGFTALIYFGGQMESITATPKVPEEYPRGFLDVNSSNIHGAKAGGIPGEILGYWELHEKYGILPWKSLFLPAIKLCEEGIPITDWLDIDIQRSYFYMYQSKTMQDMFEMLQAENDGKTFKLLKLGQTLRKIAQYGPDVFYNGEIGRDLVDDVRSDGGFLTENDLRNYKVIWDSNPILAKLPNRLKIYTTALPSMGAVVAFALNIIKSLPYDGSHIFWHSVIEAMKHALGHSTRLSDIEYESNKNVTRDVEETFSKMIRSEYALKIRKLIKDGKTFHDSRYYGVKSLPTVVYGSSNICILSPAGDAVVMTSSLMWDFTTFFWSRKTGIIFNNMIRNFLPTSSKQNLPPSYGSYVEPGKRALSPHCPVIVIDRPRAKLYFLVGASGSALIPSQVITALIQYCLLNKSAFFAVNSGFFVPDVLNDVVQLSDAVSGDVDFDKGLLEYLTKAGHHFVRNRTNPYCIRVCIGNAQSNPDAKLTRMARGVGSIVEPQHHLNTFLMMLILCLVLVVIAVFMYEIVVSKF